MRRYFPILMVVWAVMIVGAFLLNLYMYHGTCHTHDDTSPHQLIIIYSLIFIAGFFLLLYIWILSKRYRLAMETKHKELLDLNTAKDKFFSVIAHDLKTPAANIESLSQTLKEKYHVLSEEEKKTCIDILVESTKTHNELLNTLLDLSRLRLGRKQYNPERLNVRNIVNEALEQTKLQAIQKQIAQTNQTDEYFANADKDMVTTVIRNIVVNAIKFTHSGGQIVIRANRVDTEIIISIADTGIGIPDTKKDRIFEVDYNKSTTGTADEAGTGLGLVLCKEYVGRNGGRIWLESEAGKGTTFFFTLPADEK